MIILLLFFKGWHPENNKVGPNCSTEFPKDLFNTHPREARSQLKGRRRSKDDFREIGCSGWRLFLNFCFVSCAVPHRFRNIIRICPSVTIYSVYWTKKIIWSLPKTFFFSLLVEVEMRKQ